MAATAYVTMGSPGVWQTRLDPRELRVIRIAGMFTVGRANRGSLVGWALEYWLELGLALHYKYWENWHLAGGMLGTKVTCGSRVSLSIRSGEMPG